MMQPPLAYAMEHVAQLTNEDVTNEDESLARCMSAVRQRLGLSLRSGGQRRSNTSTANTVVGADCDHVATAIISMDYLPFSKLNGVRDVIVFAFCIKGFYKEPFGPSLDLYL
jgi:hypothetical protein